MDEETKRKLEDIYYGQHESMSGAYTGLKGFLAAVKAVHKGTIKSSQARNFYSGLELTQTHKTIPRPLLFREIMATGLGRFVAMDALFLGDSHRFFNYKYAYSGEHSPPL